VDALDYPVASGVSDGGGNRFDPVAFQEFLEFVTSKLGPVVVDNFGWQWIMAQPFTVKAQGDMVAGLVSDCDELQPSDGFVDAGEGMNLFNC
jgi:hypothetical protein